MLEGRVKRLVLALGGLLMSAGILANGVFSMMDDGSEGETHLGRRPASASGETDPSANSRFADDTRLLRDGAEAGSIRRTTDGSTASGAGDGSSGGAAGGASRGGVFGALAEFQDAAAQARAAFAEVEAATQPVAVAPVEASAEAPPDQRMDWTALFQQLMDKEQGQDYELVSDAGQARDGLPAGLDAASPEEMARARSLLDERGLPLDQAPPPPPDPTPLLAGMTLRGILAGPRGGVALLDGNMLRVGDQIPGTHFVLQTLLRDRIELSHPDLEQTVQLMLAPMGPPPGAPSQAAEDPVSEVPDDG